MNNLLVLTREPFVGFRPDDVLQWVEQNPSEENLALSFSVVELKEAYVWGKYEDSHDSWALYAAEDWRELREDLQEKIEKTLDSGESSMNPAPSRKRVCPYMERNGYRDASGWWIRIE